MSKTEKTKAAMSYVLALCEGRRSGSERIQTASSSANLDRECGKDLTNLWLDVVLVVDNSFGMTDEGITEAAGTIVAAFQYTQIGTKSTNPRTTRVGLVTYNAKSRVIADLNYFQSYNQFCNEILSDLVIVSTSKQSYLSNGLQAAAQMLSSQSYGSTRDHYKKVIIVYATAYTETNGLDPERIAFELKQDGVFIITVSFDLLGDGRVHKMLAKIGTPGMTFASNDLNPTSEIQQALLQANCYCPLDWEQYRTSFSDRDSFHYGKCLQVVSLKSVWAASKSSCQKRMKNSHLATEQSQAKHDFIFEYVKNQQGLIVPYTYNIGLSWSSSQNSWVWEQPAGMSPVPLNYTNWQSGFPISSSSMSGVQNVQSGNETYWQNIGTMTAAANFVCEAYSCDTDNYCDGNEY